MAYCRDQGISELQERADRSSEELAHCFLQHKYPTFSFSPLAIHTRNLLADPSCTLVLQIPGWSGLSNARVPISGAVYPLPEYQQEWAHKQYIAKHQQGPSQQRGNFYYFRMQNIRDIYFIGGLGTVAWVDVKEYEDLKLDKIALEGGEQCLKRSQDWTLRALLMCILTHGYLGVTSLLEDDASIY